MDADGRQNETRARADAKPLVADALYLTSRGLERRPCRTATGCSSSTSILSIIYWLRAPVTGREALPLTPQPVADFFSAYRAMLRTLDVDVRIRPIPTEIPDPIIRSPTIAFTPRTMRMRRSVVGAR